MSAEDSLVFVDTSVLLYHADVTDPAKQEAAERWLDALWQRGTGRLSWQVLNEYYAAGTRKNRAPRVVLRRAVETYAAWAPLDFSLALLQRAWHWVDSAGLNYGDSLIIASAEALGCRFVLSEDFQAGRQYGALEVVNPFRSDPEEFGF